VRKSPTGADLDMKSLLDAVDTGLLAELGKAIDASDHARFATAYRQALEGCYSCHKTAGKPYLRPQVPTAPAAAILNFDPDAKWPQ
jgi:cytochrome c553